MINNSGFFVGTRILMSNGSYKNIEDVVIGDLVINRYGHSVYVLEKNINYTKNIFSVNCDKFYRSIYCAENCEYLTFKNGNKEWFSVSDIILNNYKLVPLENIIFNIDNKFKIISDNYILRNSFDLGRILGFYLCNGNVSLFKQKNIEFGKTKWIFHKNDPYIYDLYDSVEKIFHKAPKKIKHDNYIILELNDNKFSKYIYNNFKNNANKKLPQDLFVNDIEYIMGLMYGLKLCNILYETNKHFLEIYGVLMAVINNTFPKMNFDNTTKKLIINKTKFFNNKTLVYNLKTNCIDCSFIANNTIVRNFNSSV